MNDEKSKPAVYNTQYNSNNLDIVWLRINAFLSLKSTNTQITYLGIINEWCSFLGVQAGSENASKAILSATDLHAIAYRNWLESRPGQRPRYQRSGSNSKQIEVNGRLHYKRDGLQGSQTNSTIKKKFAALRRIYRMLIASNVGITSNPFDPDKVPSPSARSGQKRPTEMIDFSHVEDIHEKPDPNTKKGIRDRAILALLFGAGLRRSEVTNLRLCDFQTSPAGTPFIRLRATKNKKDTDQALPPWAAETLKNLYDQRIAENADLGDPFFISYRGPSAKDGNKQQLTTNGLYRIFKEYCFQCGANRYATPHSARATAITKLLSDGVEHREVQEFSRHSSIQMVEVYDKRRYSIEQNPGKKLKY